MKRVLLLILLGAIPASLTADVLLNEPFNYADGRLADLSSGTWVNHSGTTPLDVMGGSAFINQADTTGGREDVNRALSVSFDPATDNTSRLYAGFTVNFSSLPANNGTASAGSYFAHFKSSAASEFYARIGANQEGAASGSFRLALGNEAWSSSASIEYPQDLALGVSYNVVVRLDLATDQATLWVNPVDESSTSITATDAISYAAGGSIAAFALRQGTTGTAPNDGAPGALALDNLVVATTFNEAQVIPEPSTWAMLMLGGLAFGWALRRQA
jgi:hypothetical protein